VERVCDGRRGGSYYLEAAPAPVAEGVGDVRQQAAEASPPSALIRADHLNRGARTRADSSCCLTISQRCRIWTDGRSSNRARDVCASLLRQPLDIYCSWGAAAAMPAVALRRIRETCIWDTPIRLAISCWGSSPPKRNSSTLQSRGSSPQKRLHAPSDGLDPLVFRVQFTDGLGERKLLAVLRCVRRIQRSRPIGVQCASCFGDLSRLKTQMPCHHLDGRIRPRSCPEVLLGAGDEAGAVLDRTRYMHRPSSVTEVTSDLAQDGRLGEGDERAASVRLVSVNCLDEPDASGLMEILDRLASSPIAVCEMVSVWEECDDYHLPRATVTRRAPPEQRPEIARRRALAGRCARMPLQRHAISLGVAPSH